MSSPRANWSSSLVACSSTPCLQRSAAPSSAGSALVVGASGRAQVPRRGVVAGATIDHQSAAGTTVTTGTVLFWSNGLPVIAIEGDAAATPALARDLYDGVDDGADVKLFEQALSAAGFTADTTLVVDDHSTRRRRPPTSAWLAALGVTADPATSSCLPVPSPSYPPACRSARHCLPTARCWKATSSCCR